ncbi:MAG TPA: flagellar motor protein [Gammaproteobacteria bacterium]|nr:flagellar motor protein [Gammaproteobacteria bacterium]
MDSSSIAGLLLGIAAVVVGQYLEGGHLAMLVNGPALLIVVGGTLGATMVQSPTHVFLRALRMSSWIFRPPAVPLELAMKELLHWCRVARRDGLLGLEALVESVRNPYARKALQLLIDGNEPPVIRETLQIDSAVREQRDLLAAKVFDGMGGYAPTLGILGAVIGLIQVMNNLSDPSMLGQGIGVAFVATVYGVGLANLVFLPIGVKLRTLVREETRLEELIAIGITAIADGENPRVVESRLQGLLK